MVKLRKIENLTPEQLTGSRNEPIERFGFSDTTKEQAKEALLQFMTVASGGKKIIWDEQYNPVIDWLLDNKRKGLLLTGNNGTGKTTLLMAINGIFRHYHQKLLDVVNAIDKEEVLKVKKMKNLFIDDMGTEVVKSVTYGDVSFPIPEIISNMEAKGKLLVATTNLSAKELIDRYGARAYDRIKGNCLVVVIEGESKRDVSVIKPK